ncbi:MAG: hypothetical protein ACKPJD_09810, partial [Planctomycetaceae bacterium]
MTAELSGVNKNRIGISLWRKVSLNLQRCCEKAARKRRDQAAFLPFCWVFLAAASRAAASSAAP